MQDMEKRISKIISKSMNVDSIDTSRNELIDITNLDDFEKPRGDTYFCEKEPSLYKKSNNMWMRYKLKPTGKSAPIITQEDMLSKNLIDYNVENKDIEELKENFEKMKVMVGEFSIWGDKVTEYFNEMFELIKKEIIDINARHEDDLKAITENYELKIKQVDDKLEKYMKEKK